MKDNKHFRLQSFYLAAFLLAKGMELVSIDKEKNPRRATFVFLDLPDREAYVATYNYCKEDAPDTRVDARKLVAAIKTLKEKLYLDNF